MQPNIISDKWSERVARLTEEAEQKNVPSRVPEKTKLTNHHIVSELLVKVVTPTGIEPISSV